MLRPTRALRTIPRVINHLSSIDSFKYVTNPKIVRVVGAPLADGQPLAGVEQGPSAIRRSGLQKRLEKDGWLVEDNGDLDFHKLPKNEDPGMHVRNARLVGGANQMIYDAVLPHAEHDKFCLTLGGDHSIGIGSIAAILKARPDVGIVWVDAHADINTPSASASGNIHGMVLSFLMGLDNARNLPGFNWMKDVPLLPYNRIVYIGLRDIDPPERQLIKDLGLKAFSMKDIDKYGMAKVVEQGLDHLLSRTERPLHLSFDIDSVDPFFAPSTGTRVAGGITYREAYYLSEAVAETGLLGSMDLVEVNPSLSGDEGTSMTVDMAVGLISSALGNKIL